MVRFIQPAVLLLLLALLPHWAAASATYVQPLGEAFLEERAKVMKDIESGRFAKLSEENRVLVLRLLDEMAATLEGIADIRQIQPEVRSRLLNQQHQVNNLLTSADPDQRVVCRRERSVGSHFPVNKCATVAEWRMIVAGTREKMERRRNPCLTYEGERCTPASDMAFENLAE